MAKKYLSWEVVVRLLRKISVVWRQMRHNIISICYSDCVWHNFAIVSSKYRITDSRLSKCHRLNIFLFLINLGIRKTKRKEKKDPLSQCHRLEEHASHTKLQLKVKEITCMHQEPKTNKQQDANYRFKNLSQVGFWYTFTLIRHSRILFPMKVYWSVKFQKQPIKFSSRPILLTRHTIRPALAW